MSFFARSWNLNSKVCVGNLGEVTTENEILEIFSRYGEICFVFVAPKNFALLEFKEERHAVDAVRALNGTKISGARVTVDIVTGRPIRAKEEKIGWFKGSSNPPPTGPRTFSSNINKSKIFDLKSDEKKISFPEKPSSTATKIEEKKELEEGEFLDTETEIDNSRKRSGENSESEIKFDKRKKSSSDKHFERQSTADSGRKSHQEVTLDGRKPFQKSSGHILHRKNERSNQRHSRSNEPSTSYSRNLSEEPTSGSYRERSKRSVHSNSRGYMDLNEPSTSYSRNLSEEPKSNSYREKSKRSAHSNSRGDMDLNVHRTVYSHNLSKEPRSRSFREKSNRSENGRGYNDLNEHRTLYSCNVSEEPKIRSYREKSKRSEHSNSRGYTDFNEPRTSYSHNFIEEPSRGKSYHRDHHSDKSRRNNEYRTLHQEDLSGSRNSRNESSGFNDSWHEEERRYDRHNPVLFTRREKR